MDISFLFRTFVKQTNRVMNTNKRFKVEFKESYFPHSVEKECSVPNEREVIRIYGLDEPNIEWYKITEIK